MKVLAAIWLHAAHVKRYLSYYFSPNTHLTGEALGLFYAGVLFREFADAARWRELGARILVDGEPAADLRPTASTSSSRPAITATPSRSTCISCCSRRATA